MSGQDSYTGFHFSWLDSYPFAYTTHLISGQDSYIGSQFSWLDSYSFAYATRSSCHLKNSQLVFTEWC